MSWVCPHCGRKMFSQFEACGGSFLETEHPPSVSPVRMCDQCERNPAQPSEIEGPDLCADCAMMTPEPTENPAPGGHELVDPEVVERMREQPPYDTGER